MNALEIMEKFENLTNESAKLRQIIEEMLLTMPATGIIFRETPGTYDYAWHPAPRRQYIINLDEGVQITASDGEVRIIAAGEVILVEDTHGKGHCSKAISEKMRHSIFVPIE